MSVSRLMPKLALMLAISLPAGYAMAHDSVDCELDAESYCDEIHGGDSVGWEQCAAYAVDFCSDHVHLPGQSTRPDKLQIKQENERVKGLFMKELEDSRRK
ncbi:hypothetical protein HBA54_09940 [Pelagibius litoralis]|uniref:Cysteine rich repeat-containing protein n=1 Tax=Pelagibius litoralis TaxID=374515 RepID=A0A967EWY2_9PROT|nr:hypothetical protein [Pelagibius litoralis]NIA68913.1 hypothetical protein [Pelagibius litoralis]